METQVSMLSIIITKQSIRQSRCCAGTDGRSIKLKLITSEWELFTTLRVINNTNRGTQRHYSYPKNANSTRVLTASCNCTLQWKFLMAVDFFMSWTCFIAYLAEKVPAFIQGHRQVARTWRISTWFTCRSKLNWSSLYVVTVSLILGNNTPKIFCLEWPHYHQICGTCHESEILYDNKPKSRNLSWQFCWKTEER